MSTRPIDARYLKGLKFHSAESKTVVEDGRKVKKFMPTERPLEPEDVLSWKDKGDSVVIVTADGRKVTVSKSGKPVVPPDEKTGKDKNGGKGKDGKK